MAVLTVQQAVLAGLTPTYAAASVGGDSFANDGRIFLHVKNSDSSSHVTTVASQKPTVPGYTPANNAVTVPITTGDKIIGPFDPTVWNDADGKVQVTYAAVTGMTVAAIRV